MEYLAIILFLLLVLGPGIAGLLNSVVYLALGKNVPIPLYGFVEVCILIFYPLGYLAYMPNTNSCCGDTTAFSNLHSTTIYILIIFCVVAYFLPILKEKLPPLAEVLVNCFLVLAIGLNIALMHHLGDAWPINLLIALMSLTRLVANHRNFMEHIDYESVPISGVQKICYSILSKPIFKQIPVLILCAIPVLFILVSFLTLFGQKPDSLLQAFTQTYYHGFSELNHECAGIECGDDYLCTIGARGNENLVRPVRTGIRGGKPIVCSRQLLVCNAFEEVLMKRFSRLHRILRRGYDALGRFLIKHHRFFTRKIVANTIYVLLKPMEWTFLLILYAVDKHPENRIAKQYLPIDQLKSMYYEHTN